MAAPAAAAVEVLPLPRYVRLAAAVNGVIAVVIAFVVSALATSRASAHALSPAALALLVSGAAATTGVIGWVNGMAGGALDRLRGATVPACPADPCPSAPARDPFAPRQLYRSALGAGLMNMAWAAAGGGLLAVALNGRHANLLVTFLALAALLAFVSAATDAVARHRGAHAVGVVGAPVALRRRAWLEIALPLALFQMLVNVGVAVLLFHDYTPGRESGFHVLTRTVAMADVPVTVVIVSLVFNLVVSPWGTAEAALGRVEAPPGIERSSSPVGVQALVYLSLLGLVLGPLFTLVLPDAPSLAWAAAVRAAYAGLLIFVASGLAYVRGALNAPAVSAVSA